jgi:hypothetical protein
MKGASIIHHHQRAGRMARVQATSDVSLTKTALIRAQFGLQTREAAA